MGYGKVGFGRDKMCSYKHTHNSIKEYEAGQKTPAERKGEVIEKLISSDPSGVGVGK